MYFNLDCTDFFCTNEIPAGESGRTIDQYIDRICHAGVDVLLCNTNARRTNYRSAFWEAFWDGMDAETDDGQPFFAPIPQYERNSYSKYVRNMHAVHSDGIDYPGRVIRRCHHNGVSPWITLRMNDCHCNETPDHPFHSAFWKENPQFSRQGCSGYFATCLDYARPEVRDYYMKLVEESLERYDIDGLELDFMREPFIYSAGKEAEGSPILNQWIRDVRQKVQAASEKRGHPIRLGARVPSRPETALAMGLDFMTWTQERLIDVLVVTPRWETIEYDIPIGAWKERLHGTETALVGGLELIYRPYPGYPVSYVTPELARGAAALIHSQGADVVYLFNYFSSSFPERDYRETIAPLRSLDELLKLPRRVAITYRDIRAPGESYQPTLPGVGNDLTFSMDLGPISDGARCELFVEYALEGDASKPSASVNGTLCLPVEDKMESNHLVSYEIPAESFLGSKIQSVNLVAHKGTMTVHRIEALIRP